MLVGVGVGGVYVDVAGMWDSLEDCYSLLAIGWPNLLSLLRCYAVAGTVTYQSNLRESPAATLLVYS